MAEENQPEPEQKPEDVKPASDDSTSLPAQGSFLGKIRRKKKLILTAVAVVAALTGGFFTLKYFGLVGAKIYGKVGTYKVTQAEYNTLATEKPTHSHDEIVTSLLDLNFYRQAAAAAKIQVKDTEVSTETLRRTGGKKVTNPKYLRNAIEQDMLKQKLALRVPGYTAGSIILINFGQHFKVDGIGDLAPNETEALRPQYIAQDRAAADALKDKIFTGLQNASLTFNSAMSLEQNDPKLGNKTLETSLHSGAFNTQDTQKPIYGLTSQADLKKLIDQTKPGQTSLPTLIKLSVSQTTDERKDGLWVIVKVDSRETKLVDSIDTYIQAKKTELKYRKN